MKQFKKFKFRFFVLTFGLTCVAPQFSWGAACCGGVFAVPSLITGDDDALVTTSLSYSKIETDVDAKGVWHRREGDDVSQIFRVEGARIFQDRFQAGASVPVQERSRSGAQGGKSSGLGDVSAHLGYEYLTNWDYNPWKPKGIGFLSITLPTGKSIYESDDGSGLDSRGRGFWAVGLGTALTKAFVKWDLNSTFEIHRSFDKKVENSQLNGTIRPGYGGTFTIGSGYNTQNARIGGALTWSQEDAITIEGSQLSQGSLQRWATGTLSGTYLFDSEWAGTLSYSDQTLFGDPSNASLSNSIAVLFQRRWIR